MHAGKQWYRDSLPVRRDLTLFLPGARAAIIMVYPYRLRYEGDDLQAHDESGDGSTVEGDVPVPKRVASYARGRDYHRVIGRKLKRLGGILTEMFPGYSFRPHVDSSPVLERYLAVRAGLGVIGRSGLFISHDVGPACLLAGFVSDMSEEELGNSNNGSTASPRVSPVPSPDTPVVLEGSLSFDTCGSCTRCIDACPTSSIGDHGLIDVRTCLSHITAEGVGPHEDEGRSDDPGYGWLFKCDICIECCPYTGRGIGLDGELEILLSRNDDDLRPPGRRFLTIPGHRGGWVVDVRALLSMTPEEVRDILAGTPLARTGYEGLMKRVEGWKRVR